MLPFTCVRCQKEIPKGEVRFIDHDHVCATCLKPKKKKKNKGYIPEMNKKQDYFYRRRRQKKECRFGCGDMVISQEAHESTKHFCSFCSKVFRHIDQHNENRHFCDECDDQVEDLKLHQEEAHKELENNIE